MSTTERSWHWAWQLKPFKGGLLEPSDGVERVVELVRTGPWPYIQRRRESPGIPGPAIAGDSDMIAARAAGPRRVARPGGQSGQAQHVYACMHSDVASVIVGLMEHLDGARCAHRLAD